MSSTENNPKSIPPAAQQPQGHEPTSAEPTEQADLIEPPVHVVQRIAKLTRMLRDSMRELGLDEAIKDAAEAIPDARDRLRYVGRMTEQAANRVLTAAEHTQPLQRDMETQAQQLQQQWQAARTAQSADGQGQPQQPAADQDNAQPSSAQVGGLPANLLADTEAYFDLVQGNTQQTQAYLMEIIMAQDFQDLTGQVIQGMLSVITAIEEELIQVLLDSVPVEKREETMSLLNGPAIDPQASDVLSDQDEVDDLLSSLGF